MSTTLNKLEYLDETKNQIKTALNQFGAGITDETTFREYADKIDDIYNNWPKVTGEGTDITLDNTKNGKLSLELNGNTEQDGDPTPNNEIPIKVVKGSNNVVIESQNIFDELVESGSYNETTGEKATGNPYRSKNHILVDENTTYIFSINGVGKALNVFAYDIDKTYIGRITSNAIPANTSFTTPKSCRYITFYRGTSDGSEKWQIEKGTIISSYIPHSEQNYPITLPPGMEFCKIGDYEDVIFKNEVGNPYYNSTLVDGAWYKHKSIGKVVFDGSEDESWQIGQSGTANWYYTWSNSIGPMVGGVQSQLLCNYFKYATVTSTTTDEGIWISASSIRIRYGTQDTVTNFKAWLSTHNVELYYILATPIEELITDTTLINQLNNLYNNAKSYSNQTNITQTNDNLPFIISANALLKGGNENE